MAEEDYAWPIEDMRALRTSTGEHTLRGFDELRCIFVHIPKTGGTSVANSLFGNLGGSHIPLATYRAIFGESEFRSYFKFSVVRNPWDRAVSAYRSLCQGAIDPRTNAYDREWGERLAKYTNFRDFVKLFLEPTDAREGMHFGRQAEYICENDSVAVDYLARFESLPADFAHIQDVLGVRGPLLHLNQSQGPHYSEYYDPETREAVGRIFEKDIDLFGYTFTGRHRVVP